MPENIQELLGPISFDSFKLQALPFSPGFYMTGAVRSNLQQNSFDIRIKDYPSDPYIFIYLPYTFCRFLGNVGESYTIHGSYGHPMGQVGCADMNFHPETWDKMNPCQTYLSGKPRDEVPLLNRSGHKEKKVILN